MFSLVLFIFGISFTQSAVTRLRKWTGSDADNCTKSTEIQVIYFTNDCLAVTGDYEATLIRGCTDDSSNPSGYNISSTNCAWNSTMTDNDKCTIDCNYGYKDYGACDIVDNADYGDLYINEEYDCVNEWPNDNTDNYYAYWELYSDSECSNPIYREVVPISNNYEYKCVKNRAFEWRYLYFCNSITGELTMINDFNTSSSCGLTSQVNLNSKWKFTVNSTCQQATYLSTWGGPSQYYKGYCKQTTSMMTTTSMTIPESTVTETETETETVTLTSNGTLMLDTNTTSINKNSNDTSAGTGSGPTSSGGGGSDIVGPAVGITVGIVVLFCLLGAGYVNYRKRERSMLNKPLATYDDL